MEQLSWSGRLLACGAGLPPGHVRALGEVGVGLVAGLLHKVAEEAIYVRWRSLDGPAEVLAHRQSGRPAQIVTLGDGQVLTVTQRQATSAGCVARWSAGMESLLSEVSGRLLALDAATGQGWLAQPGGRLERWALGAGRLEEVLEDAEVAAALGAMFRPATVVHPGLGWAAAAPGVDAVRLVELRAGGVRVTHRLGWEVSGLVAGSPAAPVVACGYEGELAGLGAAGVVWEVRVPGVGCAVEASALHGGAGSVLVPDDEGGLVAVSGETGAVVGRWWAAADPHGAAIDVVAQEAVGVRVACSRLNHRLRVVALDDPAWEAAWEGSDPITACVFLAGGGVAVGDQAGAVTVVG